MITKGWVDNERKYKERLCCSKETRKLIMEDCKKEFIENNPEFKDVQITQDMILNRIARYYLDTLEEELE